MKIDIRRPQTTRPVLSVLLLAGAILGAVAGAGLMSRAGAASARGPVLADIDGIREPGVQRVAFALTERTRLLVRSEGLSDPKGTAFLAQGWILDLNTRGPVWSLSQAPGGSFDKKTGNWSAEQEVDLPAGIYAAYFASEGGQLPLNKDIKVLGVPIGRVEGDWGRTLKWDETGTPARWGIRVQAIDAITPGPLPSVLPGPSPDADIRVLGLRSGTVKRLGIECARPVSFDVRLTGESSKGQTLMADGAWITNLSDWRRVWAPDPEQTDPAGGAKKNRFYRGTVTLPAGSYLLTVVTDGSHAVGDWNAPPPWDPDAWGIAMKAEGAAPGAFRVTPEESLPKPAVAIERVRDDMVVRKPFTVSRPARVLVRALGEYSSRNWADHGWIERTSDLEPIWTMDANVAEWAGGGSKNRRIEQVIELKPGAYALGYATDDSHAFGDWNTEQPWEPDAWGISISELPPSGAPAAGGRTQASGAIREGAPRNAPVVIADAPARSDQHLVKRFDVLVPTRFHLIAIGEGSDDPMSDYGWLVDESTGRTVWKMEYADTREAGGAEKNREVRAEVTLPKGSYALHFQTDDSHAYGDWNSAPPLQPELWGVTLIEAE